MSDTYELPDIPVPDTGVLLTNVTVTVEPMQPSDYVKSAILDKALESGEDGALP